jgi:hypothetical protein
MNIPKLLIPAFFLALAFFACSKDDNQGDTTRLNIRMTDGPGPYDEVNVDIREVRVKMANDTSNWLSLNTNDGIYNLLDYQNGIDTLLATGVVPLDVLKEVRFVLGPNNTVVIDSVSYPLQTPSAESSGLKIKIDQSLAITADTFLLDFDALQSVKQTGNGTYKLDPVIKLK